MEVVAKSEESSSRSRRPGKKPRMENPELYEIIDLENENDNDNYRSMFFSPGKPFSQKGLNKSDPISVEQYNDERDLNLTIMASLATQSNPNFIDLSQETDDIQLPWFDSLETQKSKCPFFEIGQSSNSKDDDPDFVCEICTEPKSANESFSIHGCGHSYCTDCTAKYVASKLQENVTTITCPVPGCDGSLEPEHCRSIIPAEVFDRWGLALCEAMFSGSEKFYCPFKDCSVMLIDDGGEAMRQSECPWCYRMFCAQCKVPWHERIGCEEFQKLNKDEREKEDIMLMNLATSKQWQRCPNCRFYVERSMGCLYMQCRLVGYEFLCQSLLFLELHKRYNGPHKGCSRR